MNNKSRINYDKKKTILLYYDSRGIQKDGWFNKAGNK